MGTDIKSIQTLDADLEFVRYNKILIKLEAKRNLFFNMKLIKYTGFDRFKSVVVI